MGSLRTPLRLAVHLACASLVLLSVAGCASSGSSEPFVWADQYPADRADQYTIGVGDQIAVAVFNNDRMSTTTVVRSDGKISVPLLSDVDAAGKAPAVLAADIEKKLKDAQLVLEPHVTVTVGQVARINVAILGAVGRAGNYQLDPNAGLAEAIATAGGLTDFAHKDRIFVVRRTPTPVRIRFTFQSITSSTGKAALFRLRAGDVVVAE
jgi:polysaccharide export outer membrane protein